MSVVYLAEQIRLKRRAALKLLAPELADDARFRERFLRESELAASLDHPNVIPIFDAGETDGILYIAMRYVEGHDLTTADPSRKASSSPTGRCGSCGRSPRRSTTRTLTGSSTAT